MRRRALFGALNGDARTVLIQLRFFGGVELQLDRGHSKLITDTSVLAYQYHCERTNSRDAHALRSRAPVGRGLRTGRAHWPPVTARVPSTLQNCAR